ncbi:TonB-dependent hemoglobin/transferrin/lactoferrin family receptor [Thiothrix sp.]|jgi:hemoglobin/transferrin/lactoferrin receptor protein|uniref:TonB-dependent hemoglobin/transferrin/lactoferrin family receptor n=1 Tax=Thiothrix sp. TaxID=1032 RepID=UPI00257D3640|nr:TonB-dependent hemoglobin/transferrin/lactoferrin family receptor [Thiothrix sp.]
MFKLSSLSLAVLSALALTPSVSFAVDGSAVTPLEDVTVIATRTERSLNKVPASVSVVKQKDFAQQQANSVADVMKKLPNVDFGGGPRSDGQIPTIRGYQGTDITLLVDGARRSSPEATQLWSPLYLDPFYLKQAEVVRGPSSSLYGSGGNGGVMSFTTLNAKDLLEPDQKAGADAKAGYASGDNSHRYNAKVYGQGEQTDFLLGMGYRDFDSIERGDDGVEQQNSGHTSSGLLKLGVEPSEKVRIELSGQTSQGKNYRPNNPQVVTATPQQTHTSQDNTVLRVTTKNNKGEKALDAKVYNNKFHLLNDAAFYPPATTLASSEYTTDTTGLGVQNTSRLQDGKHTLTYGVDVYKDKFTTLRGGIANPVNPDGTSDTSGVFLQDEIELTSKLRITPSVRYDKFETKVSTGTAAATKFSHTSPKLAVAYQATPDLTVYGNYGQAYRAPTVWERYRQTVTETPFDFSRFRSNLNLKPQTDTTFEVGAKYKKEQVFSSDDKVQLRAAAFKSDVKDLIDNKVIGTFLGTRPIQQYQNVADAEREGIELEGSYERGAVRLDVGASRLRVKDKATGNNLFSPPDKLTTKVSYQLPKNTSVSWAATGAAAQDYDSTVLRRRSGYSTHDLHVGWKPNRKVEVDFGVNNVFDKKYQTYQSTQATAAYEMGRNYMISVSGGF